MKCKYYPFIIHIVMVKYTPVDLAYNAVTKEYHFEERVKYQLTDDSHFVFYEYDIRVVSNRPLKMLHEIRC